MEEFKRIEEYIKVGNGKDNFLNNTKNYFVNMVSYSHKIHKTGLKGCPNSGCAFKYIDFDTEEEARDFFRNFGKEVTLCGTCKRIIKYNQKSNKNKN